MQEFAVRSRPPAVSVTRSAPAVQRCGDHPCPPSGCNKEEEQRLSRSAIGLAPGVAPPVVHEVIRSPGEPLPASLNEGMSARFGHDFAHVRVHTGSRAAESAASVAARAYTVGQHVVLGRSAPDLHSAAGQHLLAHELTHVIQQPAAVPGGELPVSSPGDAGEREAEAAATRAVPSSVRPSVQRDAPSNGAILWRQVAPDDQEEEEERKAKSPDAVTAADAPAPAQPQDAGTPAQPQDAGTGAATAPAAVPPAAANPPAAASGKAPAAPGLAACPEPPLRNITVLVCTAPVAAKPPPKEKAEFPVVPTANFGGDADRARFAADLARCWAERMVKQEIEKRFKADVAAAKDKATQEAAADTEAAVKTTTEGVAPGDKAALGKARTAATKAAKAAAAKKVAAAQAAVTRQAPATVVAELAKDRLDWLEKDYSLTIEGAQKRWGSAWLRATQKVLDTQRAAITRAKSAKPKVKKGQEPPPAKSADEIDAEVEAEMTEVRCSRRQWALDQIEGIARAWAVGRREQVDFQTVRQTAAWLPAGFAPSYQPADADLVPVPASLREKDADPNMPGIAPELATFLTEVERALAAANPPQTFIADNYAGHGLGAWANKHFSIDLTLPQAGLDSRGFYRHAKAVSFLLTLNKVAVSMGATWRILYNDFSVAQEVNAATGSRNVEFIGESPSKGLNWHGPDPLILHFHLDIEIPKGAQAPGPAPAAAP
jgi:hypothetical protein